MLKNTKEMLTAKLESLFEEANNILKLQMDNTGKIFKTLAPEFYSLYKASRKVVDRGRRKVENGLIKGLVKNKKNEFLVDVLVQLIPDNVLVLSNENGEFEFDDIAVNTYTLKLTKQGLEDLMVQNITLKKGEEKVLDLVMNEVVKP